MIDLATKSLNVPREALKRCFAVDLERDEIASGNVGLTQDDAVVVELIPGFQIHAALVIAACDIEANHFSVMFDRSFNIKNPEQAVSGTKNPSHRHTFLLNYAFFVWRSTRTRISLFGQMQHARTRPLSSSSFVTCSRLMTRGR